MYLCRNRWFNFKNIVENHLNYKCWLYFALCLGRIDFSFVGKSVNSMEKGLKQSLLSIANSSSVLIRKSFFASSTCRNFQAYVFWNWVNEWFELIFGFISNQKWNRIMTHVEFFFGVKSQKSLTWGLIEIFKFKHGLLAILHRAKIGKTICSKKLIFSFYRFLAGIKISDWNMQRAGVWSHSVLLLKVRLVLNSVKQGPAQS